jgi:4-diphosphocytidyl-2-C-methyl-D-erythritol kinase
MRQIQALAPAKVNLTFDILGKLPDGYHQVETIMQAIDLYDRLTLSLQNHDRLSIDIHCSNETVPSGFPLDESNLMAKAAKLFFHTACPDQTARLCIDIEKNIPLAAGLAGGSSDAAAVLVALNEMHNRPLGEAQLCSLAAQLGADVPFCLVGGTCVGTGRGDKLKQLRCEIDFSYCIVKPKSLSVSTPWAYHRYDEYAGDIVRPQLQKAIASLANADLPGAIESFGNVFEPVIFDAHPQLVALKQQLLKNGAWCCQLSGSGPAIFAIVADREQAHYIRRKILKTDDLEFDYIRLSMPDLGPPVEVYIAQSAPSGVQVLPVVHQET